MIIVYQMGKVGSVAITEGLKSRGIDARHTHLLGNKGLAKELLGMLSPAPENPLDQDLNNIFANIRTTQDILKRRRHNQTVKFITLVRDPKTLWPSGFVQNFNMLYPRILTFIEENGIEASSAVEAIIKFISLVFERLAGTKAPIDDEDFIQEIQRPNGLQPYYIIEAQCRWFVRPLVWFDTCFKPVTGIDIYTAPLEKNSHIYRNDFCEVLLLRFEALADLEGEIGQFAGLSDFRLPVRNASAGKDRAREVRQAWQSLSMPEGFEAKIRATRYCRHFGY